MNTIKAQERFDEPVTEFALKKALKRGEKQRSKGVHATAVQYLVEKNALLISFADQSAVVLPVQNYPELVSLAPADLHALVIGFGGSALCLDALDLHVSIAGLVSASSALMEMATIVVASRNGATKTAAKHLAARQNGAKGGRPRNSSPAG